jgi:hypothetical protein
LFEILHVVQDDKETIIKKAWPVCLSFNPNHHGQAINLCGNCHPERSEGSYALKRQYSEVRFPSMSRDSPIETLTRSEGSYALKRQCTAKASSQACRGTYPFFKILHVVQDDKETIINNAWPVCLSFNPNHDGQAINLCGCCHPERSEGSYQLKRQCTAKDGSRACRGTYPLKRQCAAKDLTH